MYDTKGTRLQYNQTTIRVKITKGKNAAYYGVAVGCVVEMELEEYLRGVVASEVGNAPLEACKAQAVASRTAAYPYYTANRQISDASANVQCFNAKRANSDEYPNAVQAVSETAGEVLCYHGDVISPCSFSDNNGGRTVSSEERWGGARVWLIEQDDPWSTGKRTGHGVGMSQVGAENAASLGKTYTEILSFYYPGTTIQKEGEDSIMSVKASYLVEKFKTMALPWCSPDSPWKYVAGGASKGSVDCSGAFTYWYRQGGSSMYHGSNTMWRKYTTEKGKIGEIELVPGMAVFKMRQDGKEPSAFKKDGLGNFYHVGLYIGGGQVIEAQSTKTGVITSSISTWGYAARLKNTEYDVSEEAKEADKSAVTAQVYTSGGTLNMRSGKSKSNNIITRIPNAATVTVVEQGDDWCAVTYDSKSGYVMTKYLLINSESGTLYTISGTTTSAAVKDLIVEYAGKLGVTLTVTGGDN